MATSIIVIDQMIDLYVRGRLSTVEIGAKLRVHEKTVCRLLKAHGVTFRPIHERGKLAYARRNPEYREAVL